nr:unnamed protein product [Digitaria exilis]
MEVETMLEDDVFFAELSKRISLLITDDDEGADFAAAAQFIPAAPLPVSPLSLLRLVFVPSPAPATSHQACACTCGGSSSGPGQLSFCCGFASLGAHVPPRHQQQQQLAPPPYTLYHHGASYGGDSAARAVWQHQQQQQCGSKGTGVFIPRSTPGAAHPKKKGKNRGAKAARAAVQAGANALAAGAPAKRR